MINNNNNNTNNNNNNNNNNNESAFAPPETNRESPVDDFEGSSALRHLTVLAARRTPRASASNGVAPR